MRLVVDTNVLISALLSGVSLPAYLIVLWRGGRFDLVTSAEQLDEMRRVTRYPKIRERLLPAQAGRLINELRDVAVVVTPIAGVEICADPDDNYLLATAIAAGADFLISGDKRDVLALGLYQGVKIVSVRDFLVMQQHVR